jgi:hypothetical protein
MHTSETFEPIHGVYVQGRQMHTWLAVPPTAEIQDSRTLFGVAQEVTVDRRDVELLFSRLFALASHTM